MRPNVSTVRATAWSTCAASPTSHATASARRPSARTASATPSSSGRRRLHTTTCAPTFASSIATARPMPWLAPVTIATRSRSVSGENVTYWMTECGLALEAADPDVHTLVFLADEAAEDHHPHLHLERDDLLLHALHPVVALTRMHVVLPELEEHDGLLVCSRASAGPAPKGYCMI